jgi:hypothetical protein
MPKKFKQFCCPPYIKEDYYNDTESTPKQVRKSIKPRNKVIKPFSKSHSSKECTNPPFLIDIQVNSLKKMEEKSHSNSDVADVIYHNAEVRELINALK